MAFTNTGNGSLGFAGLDQQAGLGYRTATGAWSSRGECRRASRSKRLPPRLARRPGLGFLAIRLAFQLISLPSSKPYSGERRKRLGEIKGRAEGEALR